MALLFPLPQDANIKYGKLGDDALEIDVVEDVWKSAFTIYGTPGVDWTAPGVDPYEQPYLVGETDTVASCYGYSGVGTEGEAVGIAAAEGTCTSPAPSSSPSTSISASPSSSPS